MKHTLPNLEILEVPYAKNWTGEQVGEMKQHKWDWTYCSDYNCTITSPPPPQQEQQEQQSSSTTASSFIISGGKILGTSITQPPIISTNEEESTSILSECTQGGIDLNLLRAQDDILFYDDFVLYQV